MKKMIANARKFFYIILYMPIIYDKNLDLTISNFSED